MRPFPSPVERTCCSPVSPHRGVCNRRLAPSICKFTITRPAASSGTTQTPDTPHTPPTCLSQYPTLLMPACSSKDTRSTTLHHPAITVNNQLTTPQQLRRRRWRCYSKHRRLPDYCPNRSDLSRTLRTQQDRHKPSPEDNPYFRCGNDTAGTRSCTPCGEASRHGQSAARGRDG